MTTWAERFPSLANIEANNEDFVESHDGREARLLAYLNSHSSHDSFSKDPSTLLAAIDRYASHHEFLINIGEDKARILRELVLKEKPEMLVEVGGYTGYSAVLFAQAMRDASPNSKVKVYSLELSEEFGSIIRNIVRLGGLDDIVEVIVGDAQDGLKHIKERLSNQQIDVLFLDHDEELYTREFKLAVEELDLLGRDGVVIADNVVRPGAPTYRKYVRELDGWESQGLPGLIMPGEFEVSASRKVRVGHLLTAWQDELEVSRRR